MPEASKRAAATKKTAAQKKDEPEGAITPEKLAQSETSDEDTKDTKLKSVSKVAQEVIEGKWGLGQQRRRNLSIEGYDVKAVEDKVVELLNKQ